MVAKRVNHVRAFRLALGHVHRHVHSHARTHARTLTQAHTYTRRYMCKRASHLDTERCQGTKQGISCSSFRKNDNKGRPRWNRCGRKWAQRSDIFSSGVGLHFMFSWMQRPGIISIYVTIEALWRPNHALSSQERLVQNSKTPLHDILTLFSLPDILQSLKYAWAIRISGKEASGNIGSIQVRKQDRRHFYQGKVRMSQYFPYVSFSNSRDLCSSCWYSQLHSKSQSSLSLKFLRKL